jgi:hypothetical protein
VPFFAIVDEAGFQRRLDAGDDAFVDVGLALFAPGCLDIDVDELLPVDDGYCVALNNMRFILSAP